VFCQTTQIMVTIPSYCVRQTSPHAFIHMNDSRISYIELGRPGARCGMLTVMGWLPDHKGPLAPAMFDP
jgi:hypothetical protein